MTALRLALAQFDFPFGAIVANAESIGALIARARDEHGARLIVFPELCVSGYSPEDLLLRPQFLADCTAAIESIARSVHGITAIVGWPESAGPVVYNAASVIRDGRIERTYRKRDLPNHAVFDERRYFETDPDGGVCVFEIDGIPIGLLICQDLWGKELMHETAEAGASLVVVPNASPFESEKHAERNPPLAARARETGCAGPYVTLVGGPDDTVFVGASLLAQGDGRVLPVAQAFTEHLLVVDFNPEPGRFRPSAGLKRAMSAQRDSPTVRSSAGPGTTA